MVGEGLSAKTDLVAFLGLLLMGGVTAGLIFASPTCFLWVGLAIWGWATFSNREVESNPFLQAFKDADVRVQSSVT